MGKPQTFYFPASLREAIYKRDGDCCTYCGSKHNLTLDHVIPQSLFRRKGQDRDNSPFNLVTACRACNGSRQDKPIRLWKNALTEARIRCQVFWPLDGTEYPGNPWLKYQK